MNEMHHFKRIQFNRFKAFKRFALELRDFNVLVGPNNAGKSTVLVAFRILATAMRKANSKSPTLVEGPNGIIRGYQVDIESISVAEENIFYNYDDSLPATIEFTLDNGNSLILFFPSNRKCFLSMSCSTAITSPSLFRKHFKCPIGSVPILGPVEHGEELFEKEAARLALLNFRAARNFRNIWHHYPEQFNQFRETIQQTWHGMDVQLPEIDDSYRKPRLHMFCPENRIPREIFWAGCPGFHMF